MSAGGADGRAAAALFWLTYGGCIRRRVRSRLGGTVSGVFDSQDILATVGRRLDRYVLAGRLKIDSEASLWSLVFRIVDAAVVDKKRMATRHELADRLAVRRFESASYGDSAEGVHLREHAHEVLNRALLQLSDETDRFILKLWMSGNDHQSIGAHLGLSRGAVRIRWHRIRSRLREEALRPIP